MDDKNCSNATTSTATSANINAVNIQEFRATGTQVVDKGLGPLREMANELNGAHQNGSRGIATRAREASKDYRVPVHKSHVPIVGPVGSLPLKQLLCGIIAGGVSGVLCSPFDRFRSQAIAEMGGDSAWKTFMTAIRKEGLNSVVKGGFGIGIAHSALTKGFQFWGYEAVKRNLENLKREKNLSSLTSFDFLISTTAGAFGGFASTLVSYPFDSLLDRLILEPKKYKGFGDAVITISRNEGIKNLYRGINPALLSMAINSAITFHVYDFLQAYWKKQTNKTRLSNFHNVLFGAAAGAVASFISYPIECMRKQINMSAVSSTNGRSATMQYDTMSQALTGIFNKEGVRGFYRGVGAQSLKMISMAAFSFAVYEVAKRVFIAHGVEEKEEVVG